MTKREAYIALGAAAHTILLSMEKKYGSNLLDLAIDEIEVMESLANLESVDKVSGYLKKYHSVNGWKASSTVVAVGYAISATKVSALLTVTFKSSERPYLYVVPKDFVDELLLSIENDPDAFSMGAWVNAKLRKPAREFLQIDPEILEPFM